MYTTTLKFPVAAVPSSQLQSDLQGMIDRSSSLKNPTGIQVEVVDRGIILRGQVADEDERRLIENMIRLTPGVRDVKNDLTVRETAKLVSRQ